MEEIKVGDYVRVNGIIGKVEQIGNSLFWIENGSSYSLDNKKVKHSKNIIDLIEVGDYVNGEKVIEVHLDLGYVFVDKETELGTKTFCDYQIETILTHEQMEENQYVVKRNMETN